MALSISRGYLSLGRRFGSWSLKGSIIPAMSHSRMREGDVQVKIALMFAYDWAEVAMCSFVVHGLQSKPK